jgi:cysteine synthase
MMYPSNNAGASNAGAAARSSTLWTTLIAVSSATAAISYVMLQYVMNARRQSLEFSTRHDTCTAHEQLIVRGTPMVKLEIVSKLFQRNIYVKMESLNPGGTGKDRAALSMIRRAEAQGALPPPTSAAILFLLLDEHDLVLNPTTVNDPSNGTTIGNRTIQHHLDDRIHQLIVQAMTRSRTGGLVVEGTSGSTGIALATLCASRGHACLVILPDDQAKEKQTILRSLGAVVYEVPTAAISNPNHYVNVARKVANVAKEEFHIDAIFTDQFENEANFDMHYCQTGPEIWKQRNGTIDAFVMSSGTGGTIAGVGTYLKEKKPSIQIVLVDPPGSALYHKIEHGIAYAVEQRERTLKKHRYDTLAEGIGLDRVTHNFEMGLDSMDRALRVTDQEAVDMAHWILRTEGLWIGSSSAMNMVGALRVALDLPRGSNVVTMICDAGQRHATRFWNPVFIESRGLQWPDSKSIPECVQTVLGGVDEGY